VHRGTRDSPGLVLGLDRGGACRGMAFRISSEKWDEVIDYLRARELVTNVYLERRVRLQFTGGRRVEAVTYVADRDHEQYAGTLDAFEAARVVNEATGQSGPNDAYVFNTLAHLRQMGIRDQWLEQVASEVERLRAA
ncbi:gamma-glutamylcyclotransferase, partial [Rhizobium sp.]